MLNAKKSDLQNVKNITSDFVAVCYDCDAITKFTKINSCITLINKNYKN